MICFGYEARGDGTPDVCYYTVSPTGQFTEVVWLVAPVAAMIHDFAVTDNWWFHYKNSFPGHTANAYEDEKGHLVVDLGLSETNVFFWWPDGQGRSPEPSSIRSQLVQFTLDPQAVDLVLPEPKILHQGSSEFYRIDDRFATQPYRHCYFDLMDPELGTDFERIGHKIGGGHPLYNSLAHFDNVTGKTEIYYPGNTHLVQEPVFISRKDSTTEGDGYVMALINNYETMASELHLLDSRDFTRAQAKILLPVRLLHGLHGKWVDGRDIEPSTE
ncbi:Lignostilbene-alpha,beta-dioxygenase isozyme III [Penicillium subrubescens]|uniref:Lignostilbene-alpha,beta-dioxygenase isozyme III n=1 Tax=Penicillium subrubescens TaxID=1316194 RepID=A0A1Q5TG13_9EURO|nr:Lignostilbene-alpha,beta-dioxygenase isozyme III [Penicillium subrubescens]